MRGEGRENGGRGEILCSCLLHQMPEEIKCDWRFGAADGEGKR